MKINFLANGIFNIFLIVLAVVLLAGGIYFYTKSNVKKAAVITRLKQQNKNLKKKVQRLGRGVFMSYSDVADGLRKRAARKDKDDFDKLND